MQWSKTQEAKDALNRWTLIKTKLQELSDEGATKIVILNAIMPMHR